MRRARVTTRVSGVRGGVEANHNGLEVKRFEVGSVIEDEVEGVMS